jgi:hypothetical protein
VLEFPGAERSQSFGGKVNEADRVIGWGENYPASSAEPRGVGDVSVMRENGVSDRCKLQNGSGGLGFPAGAEEPKNSGKKSSGTSGVHRAKCNGIARSDRRNRLWFHHDETSPAGCSSRSPEGEKMRIGGDDVPMRSICGSTRSPQILSQQLFEEVQRARVIALPEPK